MLACSSLFLPCNPGPGSHNGALVAQWNLCAHARQLWSFPLNVLWNGFKLSAQSGGLTIQQTTGNIGLQCQGRPWMPQVEWFWCATVEAGFALGGSRKLVSLSEAGFALRSWFRSRRVHGKMEFLTAGWSALSGKNRCGFLGHLAAGIVVCECLQAHCWSCAAWLHACLLSFSHLVFPSQGLARHGFHAVGCSVTVVLERESALQTTVTLQSQWHYSQRLKGWAKEKTGANN